MQERSRSAKIRNIFEKYIQLALQAVSMGNNKSNYAQATCPWMSHCKKIPLPMAYFSEDAGEDWHKLHRRNVVQHSRQNSQRNRLEDVFMRGLYLSDPKISLIGSEKRIRLTINTAHYAEIRQFFCDSDKMEEEHDDKTVTPMSHIKRSDRFYQITYPIENVYQYICSARWPLLVYSSHSFKALYIPENKFIRVSKLYSEGKQGKFLSYIHEDARTLYESFRRGAKVSNNGRCLGWRERPNKPYQWIHYNETLLRAKNIGSGLIACGLIPGPRTAVGLYSQNCPEWILTEQACYTYSLVVVPLHDTLGPDACEYIINETEISTVICDDDKKCSLLLDKAPRSLRKLIVIKEISLVTYQKANDLGIQVHKFEDIERIGSQNTQPEVPPKPLDLCTICYTPSTTGNPQGVMLTHQNIMAGICSVLLQLGDYKPTSKDTMISFLPLAHMLERCCENGIYAVGGSVGFYSGNIRKLSQDMKALKPTFMPAVPRLLNRLYEKVHFDIQNSFFKRIVFNMGIRAKETHIKKSIISKNSIWDRLIFKKIQSHLGGKLRLMIVGSAPLAGNILTFARCTLGCLIVEGYGQTECCAPITLTLQGDHTTDHVGPPVACCCIKLVDIPEMEYYVVNNQGEICVKGTNVFVGYYKNPQKTEEIIDQQGWHHTGDIGMWLPNGTLKIIDRKKHIFKLSQGEHVVPEKIEKIYIRSQYVHQVFVYGESLKSCVIAVVVPDANTIKCWAAENNISGTLSVLCANSKVKTIILNDMFYFGKNAGLKTFEQVKDIYIHPDPFSVQNGLLGPTLKLKRSRLRTYFKPQLEDLYQHLD